MQRLYASIFLALLMANGACGANDQKSVDVSAPNAEVESLYLADQADRRPEGNQQIDWSQVGPRDDQRRKRVLELYRAGSLTIGVDYYHAAMILQHGEEPEDYLLCHELCVTAVFAYADSKASWVNGAKWLAAASEDRFLQSIGRKQRFATQYRKIDPDPAWRLGEIEEGVTDRMRAEWHVPSLADARKREADMNKR